MQSYRDLLVWSKAMELVVEVYRITGRFPKHETYGLANQMQRAAVSVPANVAEGSELKKTKAYLRHLSIAGGSLAELETQLELAGRLSYLGSEDANVIKRANEVGRMLSGLRRSLQARQVAQNPRS
jgi:four helix bundle protein